MSGISVETINNDMSTHLDCDELEYIIVNDDLIKDIKDTHKEKCESETPIDDCNPINKVVENENSDKNTDMRLEIETNTDTDSKQEKTIESSNQIEESYTEINLTELDMQEIKEIEMKKSIKISDIIAIINLLKYPKQNTQNTQNTQDNNTNSHLEENHYLRNFKYWCTNVIIELKSGFKELVETMSDLYEIAEEIPVYSFIDAHSY